MLIQTEGTLFEQGKAHGTAAKELIAENIQVVKHIVTEQKGVGLDFYRTFVQANAAFIERERPDTTEEMRGIAEGSGIPYEDILLVNVLLFLHAEQLLQDCSIFVCYGPATLDGKTYMAKTRDISYPMRHVAMRRKYQSGVTVCEVNPAGAVTWPGSGINSAGLAVATTGVSSAAHRQDPRLAAFGHVIVNPNYVLQACETVADAIAYIKNTPRLFSVNFVLADKERVVCAEVTKDEVEIVEPVDGILVRSNHFHHPNMLCYNAPREEYLSTYNRYQRGMGLLQGKRGEIRFQEMLGVISDHEGGGDGAICRHGLPRADGTTDGYTAYGSISVSEDGQLWTAFGNPCQSLWPTEIG